MEIQTLYQDADLIVCIKPPNMQSEQTPAKNGFADLLAEKNGGYIGVIHRLDMGVGGVMVYAKNRDSAAKLSAAVQSHTMQKEYLAVVHGLPADRSGKLDDLLFHDRRQNKTFKTERMRSGVKEASLDYTVLESVSDAEGKPLSLVHIRLITGRTHQIRAQFSARSMPLFGDGKYGARGDRSPIALFCYRITFPHPKSGKQQCFSADFPTAGIWTAFSPPAI